MQAVVEIARECVRFSNSKTMKAILREALSGSRYIVLSRNDLDQSEELWLRSQGFAVRPYIETLAAEVRSQLVPEEIEIVNSMYKISW